MLINEKINLKRYIPLSVGLTGLTLAFSQNWDDAKVILIVYAATLANHFMLLYIISHMLSDPEKAEDRKPNKLLLFIFFIGKVGVIVGACAYGWQFMANRIIIPVLNYVVQIFVLAVSARQKS